MENKDTWTNDTEALLDQWIKRARECQHSHHEAGKAFKRINYYFSVPVIVISTSLGGIALMLLGNKVSQLTILLFGIGGLVTALLSAIQTHFNFSEKGEKHSSVGARYGYVRREMEQIKALPKEARGNAKLIMDSVRERLDGLGSEGPVVSRRIFNKSNKILKNKDQGQ
jgi:hypothetical protein